MLEQFIISFAFFKPLQVIRCSRANDVIAYNNRSFLDHSILLKQKEIFEIQIFLMIDEDHIVGTVRFDEFFRILDYRYMDCDPFRDTCMLLNLTGNVRKFFWNFNSMDMGLWEGSSEPQRRVSTIPSDLQNRIHLFSFHILINDGSFLRPEIHHPVFLAKSINFINSLIKVTLLNMI